MTMTETAEKGTIRHMTPTRPAPHARDKKSDKVLNIRVSADVKTTLEVIATYYGVSLSEYIRAMAISEIRGWEKEQHRKEMEKAIQETKRAKAGR